MPQPKAPEKFTASKALKAARVMAQRGINSHRAARRLTMASLFYFGALLLLWLVISYSPERFWPIALLTFAPPFIFLLPALWLILRALKIRRARFIALQIPALLFWIVAFSGCHVAMPPPVRSTNTLRVMTYNIRYGSLGIDKVIATIHDANPEVLCVQESLAKGKFPDPTTSLKRALPGYYFARYGELLIFSRYPILKHQRHALKLHNGSGVLEAQLEVNNQKLTVFCAHFMNPIDGRVMQWPREITTRAAVREQQLLLVQRLARRTKNPFIIAGDFNTPPRGVLYRQLAARFEDGFTNAGTGFGLSFPARFPVARIDYVWSGNKAHLDSCNVIRAFGSDHRPLLAEVWIGPTFRE